MSHGYPNGYVRLFDEDGNAVTVQVTPQGHVALTVVDPDGLDTLGKILEAIQNPEEMPSAEEANKAIGSLTDAAATTDSAGSLSAKLRGLIKWAFERMPAALGQALMSMSLPVTIASDQSAVQAGALVDDAPQVFTTGVVQPLSMTTDGRLRVAVAEARVAEAPFNDAMREMWGDLRAWEAGKGKPYYDGSPWANW